MRANRISALAAALVLASSLPGCLATTDDDSILAYTPNKWANAAFSAIYMNISFFLFAYVIRRREWFALCLPIGAFFSGVGFPLRILYGHQPRLAVYIAADFCIVLSPMAYFAWNYLWFGRLAHNMEADDRIPKALNKGKGKWGQHLTWISPRKMKTLFVTSDVLTFMVQAGGGGMQVSDSLASTGSKIFLIGIILQAASYGIFLILVARTRWLCRGMRSHPLGVKIDRALYTLYFSSVWIIVRSIYRSIELAGGYDGKIFRTEIYFLIFDAAPLALAIGIYVFFWPSRFVSLRPHPLGFPDDRTESDNTTYGGGGLELSGAEAASNGLHDKA